MPPPPPSPTVEVYWRPGCRYCAAMRATLGDAGVSARWCNIWKDPDARAFVRSVADGNETVPTVRVGDEVMVAPRPHKVVERVAEIDPSLVADSRPWPPLRLAHLIVVATLLVAAGAVMVGTDSSWGTPLVGVALAAHMGLRWMRGRRAAVVDAGH
ncbi:MAG: glutaredoxin domain-containing protein [Acidimicrobiales bacterium]|nr:glutaredoxin domain-containing protein [Acidimicrobiales bacterium]